MVQDLHILRNRIEEIDRTLVNLIARRAALVQEVGQIKKQLGLPISDPAREDAILLGLKSQSHSPLTDEHIHRIFELIFHISKTIQRKPEHKDDHRHA